MNVGILGAGQLGRMLALAGYPLGLRFRVYDQASEAPAEHVADHVQGRFDDLDRLAAFAEGLDVVTYEFENVPVDCVEFLARRMPVFPPVDALRACQHRLREKELFTACGIPVAPYASVESRSDLDRVVHEVGLPSVLKSCRMGYDGKGQSIIRDLDRATLDHAWQRVGEASAVLERFVAFDREVSILGARNPSGAMVYYPLVENVHRDGILWRSHAPAPDAGRWQSLAETYVRRVMERFNYAGVMAIEFFQVGSELVANEAAPRVHNTGHWTIEGATTSQFENHIRAVCGWPLGSADAVGHSVMFNLIGSLPDVRSLLAIDGVHVHLYGKAPRPGRKLGHLTVWGASVDQVWSRAERVQTLLEPL